MIFPSGGLMDPTSPAPADGEAGQAKAAAVAGTAATTLTTLTTPTRALSAGPMKCLVGAHNFGRPVLGTLPHVRLEQPIGLVFAGATKATLCLMSQLGIVGMIFLVPK